MVNDDTIVALSSGQLPSGIAVIRVSGEKCGALAPAMLGRIPEARRAKVSSIVDPATGEVLDRGVVLYFASPESFTGEDCLEFHIHGGKAVVGKFLDVLTSHEGVRIAEPGEFTRRAFENGKIDLTEAEGISDLIAAQTEEQRKLAFEFSSGTARELVENWRTRLIRILALYTAEIDFVDEDDVPDDVSANASAEIASLCTDISKSLNDNNIGEIIHDGYRVVISGKPNVGKSSLLNALAKRDVAIVSEVAGTTRDVLDVNLDIAGFHVIVSDTAGIRVSDDLAEKEGIRRAIERSRTADLEIVLLEDFLDAQSEDESSSSFRRLTLVSKDDEGSLPEGQSVSAKTGYGLDKLVMQIGDRLKLLSDRSEPLLITRKRHRDALNAALELLTEISDYPSTNIELQVENLRLAGNALGKITGVIDVEDLLDVIFSEFCVGK